MSEDFYMRLVSQLTDNELSNLIIASQTERHKRMRDKEEELISVKWETSQYRGSR